MSENSSSQSFFQLPYNSKIIGDVDNNQDLYHITVIASKDYVLRVLSLYDSLVDHSDRFKLWVCCIDREAFRLLKKLRKPHMVFFMVKQIENSTLKVIKKERQMNEYCWTIKAPLIEYLLTSYHLESILYIDGDLYFFSDPKEIFDEWGSASVYLTTQRDLEWVEKKYGKYQAGMVGFRNDRSGLRALKWWKKRCIEWCYKMSDGRRFGDQKYLDKIPELYKTVKISKHLGINAAPWNCVYNNNYKIEIKENDVYLNKDKIVAYHFACLSVMNEDEYELWSLHNIKIPKMIKKHLYEPYIRKIRKVIEELKIAGIKVENYFNDKERSKIKNYYKFTPLRVLMDESEDYYCFCTIVSKEYLIKGLALYHSLEKHAEAFHLWICCMDQESLSALKKLALPHATLITASQIHHGSFSEDYEERTLTETCWTMKPLVCNFVLNTFSEIDHLVYCDADMYFYSSPKPLFDSWSSSSVFLSKQRSTKHIESLHGVYQAGLIGFKQEPNSRKILNWWEEKCLDWCYDSFDDPTRWGDQKYLNQVPHLFSNIKTIGHKGIDAAPWNLVMKSDLKVKRDKERILLGETPLVCYHFGSLLMLHSNKFELWKLEKLAFHEDVIKHIYLPYLENLQKIYRDLRKREIISDRSDFLSTPPSDYTPKNIIEI